MCFQSHRKLQAAYRKFLEEVVVPDARTHEEDGKRPNQQVFEELAKLDIIAMRCLGPGKHLKGRTLMGGVVKPEEVSYSSGTPCSVLTLTMSV